MVKKRSFNGESYTARPNSPSTKSQAVNLAAYFRSKNYKARVVRIGNIGYKVFVRRI